MVTSNSQSARSAVVEGHVPTDSLGMSIEEMRELAHWVVDAVIDHMEFGSLDPVVSDESPEDLLGLLGGPVPEEPGDAKESMELIVDGVLSFMQHGDHPRYFARVPGPSSFAGVLGSWLSTGFNANSSSWAGGAGPAAVELVVIEWLRTLLGMPEGTEGVLLSGGSMANLTGLAAARESVGQGVAYLSDQTHASIARDLAVMGFTDEEIRILPSDENYRHSVSTVRDAIAEDRRMRRRPAIIVATAGSTNCGAVDPLDELADICAEEGMWLHVDGAYGAPAALCDAGRRALKGIERADSLVLDPHKWLFQPYDVGCVLVRRTGALADTFAMSPEYLKDTLAVNGEVDFRDRSPELTRPPRALKLWLSLRTYGVRRFRAAIAHGIEQAEFAERVIRESEFWEIVTPAQLGMVTFSNPGASREQHANCAAALVEDGFAAVTSSTLHGRPVLRLCTINPRTTHEDIVQTIHRLTDFMSSAATVG